MKDIKKKKQRSISWLFLLLICLSTGFMGIGFAQINTTLNISGNIATLPQENLFITEVNYVSDIGADLNNSNILNTYQTILDSNVALSQNQANSKITYEIKIYNSTDSDYVFKEPVYMLGENTYDNENIEFSLDGITRGNIIRSKEYVTFRINFYYRNNIIPTDNQLRSVINFEFEQYIPLVLAGTLNTNSATGIFGGPVDKSTVEKMYFVNHENVPSGATMWDASVEGNYAITGWAVDVDQNGLNEVYFGANNGRVALPANCNALFYFYGSLKSIDFGNIDTSQVTDMSLMFAYSYALEGELDLSMFDTSNVTKMTNMFTSVYKVKRFNLSSFDLSSITSLNNMFSGTSPELIEFNNASFSNLSTTYGLIPNISTNLIVVVKDEVEKAWMLSNIASSIGANTEILTVAEYQNRL